MSGVGRFLALAAIRGYQRWLSPRKGFCCAFRAATGGDSCSRYGCRVIERFGLRCGLGLPCDASCCDLHHGGCTGDALNCSCASGDCSWGRSPRNEVMEKEQRYLEAITERARRRREDERELRKKNGTRRHNRHNPF